MSILGALKVQKANQQSIADLAALPQNQIIRLAQMGQIPSDVVPVVISEKARMAQEAANMRAAQQAGGGEMPTVIEQAMRANAQQEMPRAAAESGVAGIPLGQMFREENFKSGGIVAFQSGGLNANESKFSIERRIANLDDYINNPTTFREFADRVRKENGKTEKDKGYSNFELAGEIFRERRRLGAQVNASGASDEMTAGEAEARVPPEPVNSGIAAAAQAPQSVAPPVGIAAAQAVEPAAVAAAEGAAPPDAGSAAAQNSEAPRSRYFTDEEGKSDYRTPLSSIDPDSYTRFRGYTEQDAIQFQHDEEARARGKAAHDKFMEEIRTGEYNPAAELAKREAAEKESRAAAVENIRRDFGDDAAAYYLKHGYYYPGATLAAPQAAAPQSSGFGGTPDPQFLSMESAQQAAPQNVGIAAAAPPAAVVTPSAAAAAPSGIAAAVPPAAAARSGAATADDRDGEAEAAMNVARASEGAAPSSAAAAPKGFEEVLANIRRAYGGPETGNITPERKAYLDMLKSGSMSPRDIERQQGVRFLQAGLGILGGKSRHALQNIGEGSKEALQGYAEDLKGQRAQKISEAKSAAEIADLRRAEQRQEVNTALDLYGKQLDREQRARLAAEKDAVADRFAKNYVKKMQKSGDTRSEEELLNEGYVTYLEEAGQAQYRIRQTAETAAAGQGVQLAAQGVAQEGQRQNARATVIREWNDMKMTDPIRREYNRLASQDRKNGTNLAETFKQQQITAGVNSILGGAQTPAQPGPGTGAPPPSTPAAGVATLPPAARAQLKAGENTTFSNGQVWTLDGSGNPKRVK